MNHTDYIALNDYTDQKNYELIIRVFDDGSSFGWYRNDDSRKKIVSDSQFDITGINPQNPEDVISEKFNCYHVGRI